MTLLKDKGFLFFVLKFLFIFSLLYFGTLAVIGLSAPDGYYSPFVSTYLDYVSWIKTSLLTGSKFLLSVFGIDTYITHDFRLRITNGRGVLIAYDCVGYGVMSFWIAFVLASTGTALKKLLWCITGLFLVWLINISRISLFLVSINRNWKMPFGLDHHTLFTIAAYIAVFMLMYLFVMNNNHININKRKIKGSEKEQDILNRKTEY